MKKILVSLSVVMCSLTSVYAEDTTSTQNIPRVNVWGGFHSTSEANAYCSPNVSNALGKSAQAAIVRQRTLAAYMIPKSKYSYGELGCLGNLTKIGLSLFTGGSLSSLLDDLVERACQAGIDLANEQLSQLDGDVMANLPTGDILPGVSLGDLNVGMGWNPTIGGGSNQMSISGGNISGYNAIYPLQQELNEYVSNVQPSSVNWPDSWQSYTNINNGGYSVNTSGSSSWLNGL